MPITLGIVILVIAVIATVLVAALNKGVERLFAFIPGIFVLAWVSWLLLAARAHYADEDKAVESSMVQVVTDGEVDVYVAIFCGPSGAKIVNVSSMFGCVPAKGAMVRRTTRVQVVGIRFAEDSEATYELVPPAEARDGKVTKEE